jgi:hypothetical protein
MFSAAINGTFAYIFVNKAFALKNRQKPKWHTSPLPCDLRVERRAPAYSGTLYLPLCKDLPDGLRQLMELKRFQ